MIHADMLVRALAELSIVARRACQMVETDHELRMAVWSNVHRIRWSKETYHRPSKSDRKMHGGRVVRDTDLCAPYKCCQIGWTRLARKIDSARALLSHF